VFTITYTGFVNNEDASVIDTLPVAGTEADTNSAVGQYDITLSGGSDNNYSLVFSNGVLSVTAGALTVSAGHQTKVYGPAKPAFTGTLTGVRNGEVIVATYSSVADATSGVGSYDIVPALSGSTLTNYMVVTNLGTLSVTAAPLMVTADPLTKVYGTSDPSL